MDRERDEERRFLESLDGLLTGEGVPDADDASEDYASTMEFAQKLADLSEGPSPEFQQQLKARLLMKLTERDVAERQKAAAGGFWGFLDRLMPRSPVWRTAAVSIAVVLVTVTVAWQTGVFSPGATSDTPATVRDDAVAELAAPKAPPPSPLVGAVEEGKGASPATGAATPTFDLEITSNAAVGTVSGSRVQFPLGALVQLELVLHNSSSAPATAGPLPPSVTISQSASMRPVRSLQPTGAMSDIPPGETLQLEFSWNQLDDGGNQVIPGQYTIVLGPVDVTTNTAEIVVSFPTLTVILAED
jgi:hypothetical protein